MFIVDANLQYVLLILHFKRPVQTFRENVRTFYIMSTCQRTTIHIPVRSAARFISSTKCCQIQKAVL